MWMEMNMAVRVATLEKSKTDPLVNNKYWRPANLSAEELMRPHLVKILARKRRILLDQIVSQEEQIAVRPITFYKISSYIFLFLSGTCQSGRKCRQDFQRSKG